ncbi:MAG TPA: hypothetical protein VK668_20155 [Mucilaginibacter sp.]|nr:hypothetical protein [Mucilaginibacter sp.]
MKNPILILIIFLIASFAHAQVKSDVPTQSSSNNENVTYRLFPTTNIYNFIKLDTRNGKMWQVQWATESDKRFTTDLSLIPLVAKEDEKNGRFILQATQNIYNFILIDQIDGRTWQVQWSFDPEKRVVVAIN